MSESASNWRELVAAHDSHVHERLDGYMAQVIESAPFTAKERELLMLAAVTAMRYRPSMIRHVRGAAEAGATADELFSTIALTSLAGGVTCLREGVSVLEMFGMPPPTRSRDPAR